MLRRRLWKKRMLRRGLGGKGCLEGDLGERDA